jgi:hypothetical protein
LIVSLTLEMLTITPFDNRFAETTFAEASTEPYQYNLINLKDLLIFLLILLKYQMKIRFIFISNFIFGMLF